LGHYIVIQKLVAGDLLDCNASDLTSRLVPEDLVSELSGFPDVG